MKCGRSAPGLESRDTETIWCRDGGGSWADTGTRHTVHTQHSTEPRRVAMFDTSTLENLFKHCDGCSNSLSAPKIGMLVHKYL